ncbi:MULTISPECIES: TraA family conjugative transfer protein [unclassified Endozoicomonas]|uniref:TraA family conjugative transfer protein n=1 Tax=unclassified Endozoicomonas TaxID=2644528 RepID=UPI002149996B|nr:MULTISPECIES: TraA family conjugative transfer protein [unclassified Endozoicomonas]
MYVLLADRPPLVMKLQKLMVSLAPLIILSLLPQELQAANPVNVTGSTDFAEIYGRLVGWIKGDLGRTLSISFVLIGLAYGMARNSLIGFATGVGAAVGLQVTPTIINSIFGL